MVDARGQETIIGRYTLYDAIATGGMATVYIGRLKSETGFSRTVATRTSPNTTTLSRCLSTKGGSPHVSSIRM
jgi:hypothetical protein